MSSKAQRKGKKSSCPEKRAPQRGLGVAQLEKLRLHDEGYHHQSYPYNISFQEETNSLSSAAAYPGVVPMPLSSFHASPSVSSYGFRPNYMMGETDGSDDSRYQGWESGGLKNTYNQQTAFTRQFLGVDEEEVGFGNGGG